jgi:hypothetical protein
MRGMRLLIRASDRGDWVRYDRGIFMVSWGVTGGEIPAPGYAVLARRNVDFDQNYRRILLYDSEDPNRFLGHADRMTREERYRA